jgi:hypothetical protein
MGRLKRGAAPLCPPVQVRFSEETMKAIEKFAGPYRLPMFIREIVEDRVLSATEMKTRSKALVKRLSELLIDGERTVGDAMWVAIVREVKRRESLAIKPKPPRVRSPASNGQTSARLK